MTSIGSLLQRKSETEKSVSTDFTFENVVLGSWPDPWKTADANEVFCEVRSLLNSDYISRKDDVKLCFEGAVKLSLKRLMHSVFSTVLKLSVGVEYFIRFNTIVKIFLFSAAIKVANSPFLKEILSCCLVWYECLRVGKLQIPLVHTRSDRSSHECFYFALF